MKRLVLLLALLVSAWCRPSIGADADRALGIVRLDLENPAAGRTITSELWFPAAAGTKGEPFASRPVFRPLEIARDATPDPSVRSRPLIVISHGNFGSRFSHAWLARELVNAGYVVLSPTHPGTTGEDQTAAGRYRLWDRSRDVSFALDQIASHPRWAPLIDQARIGFVGHSFGGWTGVSLAGGRYDPARQRAFCRQAQVKDFYCEGTLKDDVASVPAHDAGASFRDTRLKAFYLMGAGPGQGFSPDSLASISAPFVVDTADLDTVLEPRANSSALARQIPGAREVRRPVGHFVYTPLCVGNLPPSAGLLAVICRDPDGVDRRLVHEQVARDAIDFFDRSLSVRRSAP